MKTLHTALLILSFLAGPASAHKDRWLPVKEDGSIPDVPARFGKVRLTMDGLGSDKPLIQLRIGEHQTTLPPCVARLIRSRKPAEVEVTGSWYHDEKRLPYYLSVRFFEPGFDARAILQPHQQFLFNLRNGTLIEAKRFAVTGNDGSYEELALPAGCTWMAGR